MNCLKITLKGLVQGVGMRPFIYNLALSLGLKGQVYNDDSGVKISICGDESACESFLARLKSSPPPLSRIDEIITAPSDESFADFKIISSQQAQKIAPILPDFAICPECLAEFYDPTNRRYNHAFINCTHCGPRFSIISRLPYDRKNTSMSEFSMCDECAHEYNDPTNRRFHAQPICCANCGPRAFLKDLKGQILASDDEAFSTCAKLLESGKIIAIKGLGGFHLCCDATNKTAIKTLRERKNRPAKPLAIMCENEQIASTLADFSKAEKALLSSQLRPIVLAKKSKNLEFQNELSGAIAPNVDKIGVFLAPTSFNLALFKHFKKPIIATSANLSGEPIITSFEGICAKLASVADFALDHDREILNPSDDSVAFCADIAGTSAVQFIRTSRGLKPQITPFENSRISYESTENSRISYENSRIRSSSENSRIPSPKNTPQTPQKTILAIGSELKNTFAIYDKGKIFLSPYIGDLKNVATKERFDELLATFRRTYELDFSEVTADLHPHFSHTKDFETQGYKVRKLQHHKAHIYSVMSENDLAWDADIIGFAFDGTGYGEDRAIWGGEVFESQNGELRRIYHFDNFAMIGGQNALKNIYFLAFALLKKYNLSAPKFFARFNQNQLKSLEIGLKATSIYTSSLGRIFDAVASVILQKNSVSYDAQAAMELEALYEPRIDVSYDFSINGEIISLEGVLKSILAERSPSVAATGFINALAALIAKIAKKHEKSVVLGGGCFANKALLERTTALLLAQGTHFYLPKNLPSGDESIALGQLYYALKDENE